MDAWFERRDPDDSWREQPKYERLVMRGEDRFVLAGRLPSGEVVERPLGPFRWNGEDGFVVCIDPPDKPGQP